MKSFYKQAALTAVFCCIFALSVVNSKCVTRGQCGPNPQKLGSTVNCLYDGPPLPIKNEDGAAVLREVCPHLLVGYENDVDAEVCCDARQAQSMYNDLQLIIGFVSRCPQCMYNFFRFVCDTACHPNQDAFTKVIKSEPSLIFPAKTAATELNYYLDDDFANGLFNSCSNVLFPGSGQLVIHTMCGNAKFSVDECNVGNWFQSSGNVNVDQVPYQMNYCFTDGDPKLKDVCDANRADGLLTAPTFACGEKMSDVGYWDDEGPCSCTDCPVVCPVRKEALPVEKCEFLGFDCFFGYSIFVAGAGFLVTLVICLYLSFRTRPKKVENLIPSWRQKASYSIDQGLRRFFYWWGSYCARNAILILITGLLVCVIFILGIVLIYHPPITDPVELWASPSSRTKLEKDYFDTHFGPFYRTTQLIFRPLCDEPETQLIGFCVLNDEDPYDFHPLSEELSDENEFRNVTGIFRKAFLDAVFKLQQEILSLTADYEGKTVRLQDVCFKPLAPDYEACTVQSIFNYYQNDPSKFRDYCPAQPYGDFELVQRFDEQLKLCFQTPTELSCLGDYGGPVFPWVALGGYGGLAAYENATALIITILINNEIKQGEYDVNYAGEAKAWEKALINFLHNHSAYMSMDSRDPAAYTFSLLTERSIEDEIQRQSEADTTTIIISYGVMFAYIAIALGQYRPCSHIFINIKPTLGIAGVLVVTFSVTSSIGFYNFIGTRMTLIILEVVPFLVLAVGVDNIFIVVQTYQRRVFPKGTPLEERIADVVSEIGPSMMLTSISEAVAFFLGALTDMPAVRIFSLYAGMAVFMNFLLQITCFVSLLVLDARRTLDNRLDVLCCIKCSCVDPEPEPRKGIVYMFFKNIYSPVVFNKFVRPLIIPLFVAVGILGAGLVPSVGLGLDQKLSMPLDSYVLRYLEDLEDYGEVGAPVYFVVEDTYDYLVTNTTNNDTISQNAICGASGCIPESLISQLVLASQNSLQTRLSTPPMSWLDEYYDWYKSCCYLYNSDKSFCPASIAKDPANKGLCSTCTKALDSKKRVPKEYFATLLVEFLLENPTEACPKGGHAGYAASVQIFNDSKALGGKRVGATNFMSYHTVLKTSTDFTDGLREAYRISDEISAVTSQYGAKVFPYCLTYVYYEQYLTIVNTTLLNVGVSIAAVYLISFILLGIDLWAATVLVVVIIFVVVDMLACMYLWEIELNAVSLVNLVMCVGITVEFCSHLIRHFVLSDIAGRYERARHSLEQMGSSVFSGITLTKLGGIIVLGFSTSRLFQVFYFRMYLLMVILGASHGLIFLPIVLSYFGPPSNPIYRLKAKKEEFELEVRSKKEQAAAAATQATAPQFIAGQQQPVPQSNAAAMMPSSGYYPYNNANQQQLNYGIPNGGGLKRSTVTAPMAQAYYITPSAPNGDLTGMAKPSIAGGQYIPAYTDAKTAF